MEAYERRSELCYKMRTRKHDTITNLAHEFGVSERTIRRDINILSLKEPIYTLQGRYGGVHFIDDSFKLKHLSKEQEDVLNKIITFTETNPIACLTEEEITELKKILSNYKKPTPE